jgi:PAS domain S-box-containing protein
VSEDVPVEQLYSQLVQGMAEAVIIASNDGTILEWNAAAERVFGWSRQQAVGENIDMLIPDNQKDQHWEGYDRVLEAGQSKYSDGSLLSVSSLKSDGTRVGIEMSYTPLRQGDKVVAIAAVVRPVRRQVSRQDA